MEESFTSAMKEKIYSYREEIRKSENSSAPEATDTAEEVMLTAHFVEV